MNSSIYKFLEIQFFILWILAVVIPKQVFIAIFVGEILLFFALTLYNLYSIRDNLFLSRKGENTWKIFLIFFAWATIILLLSYRNIPSYWNIDLLLFDKAYIYRHFMVIAELFLSIGLGYTLFKTEHIYKIKNKHLTIITIVVAVVMIYNSRYVIFLGGLFVAALSLLSIRTNNKLLLVFIPFVMISHSAYVIASVIMLAFIFLRKPFKSYFSYNQAEKIIFLILFFALLLFIYSDDLYEMIRRDENSYWRLLVWDNEINSLAKTKFTGVGFGSAYVTYDIYNIVNNANMYYDPDGRIYERLFLVANHNSILNMFYRLGIFGGILFVAWNVMMCSACLWSYNKNLLKKNNEYCWWAFTNYMYNLVIIALNPGMEMMQFAINYTFSLGVMFSIIFASNEQFKKETNIPTSTTGLNP